MAKSFQKRQKGEGSDSVDSSSTAEPIVIDQQKNWTFDSEEKVYQHFEHEIQVLELEYENLRSESDIPEESVENFEEVLSQVFEQPDEVWRDAERFENIPIFTYFKKFENYTYIVLTYMDENIPTFIFLHFPTQDEKLIEAYKRTERVYYKEQAAGEGDALSDGDELALGLYKAMLTVRSETDIPEAEFSDYLAFRDETVEEADEIWRSNDHQGNVLVTFIKDFQLDEVDFTYITVTKEDNLTESHFVLFSFPTKDKSLVERYRHGESLHTSEVVQEESH